MTALSLLELPILDWFQTLQNPLCDAVARFLSVIAAKLALEGANTAGECLYFYAPALSAGSWINGNRTYSHTIGCHRFYL